MASVELWTCYFDGKSRALDMLDTFSLAYMSFKIVFPLAFFLCLENIARIGHILVKRLYHYATMVLAVFFLPTEFSNWFTANIF